MSDLSFASRRVTLRGQLIVCRRLVGWLSRSENRSIAQADRHGSPGIVVLTNGDTPAEGAHHRIGERSRREGVRPGVGGPESYCCRVHDAELGLHLVFGVHVGADLESDCVVRHLHRFDFLGAAVRARCAIG